jgi:hypothetical protein
MSRKNGLLPISANFEPNTAEPFDARLAVPLLADLTTPATYSFPYLGMNVSVYGDTAENNGIYRLDALPHTNSESWKKIAGDAEMRSLLDLKHDVFIGISYKTPVLASDISINYTTRVLTITKTTFDVFVGDNSGGRVKVTKTGGVNFPAFPNVSGIYYFYFDAVTSNAVITSTPWIFGSIAPVYRILYNATQVGAAAESFECHLNTISGDDHKWKHAGGTIYFSGFDLIHNAIAIGSPNSDGSNTCVSITGGTNIDDNLSYTVVHNNSPANVFEQDLGAQSAGSLNSTNSGLFRIKWDTGGEKWTLPATRFPFDFTGNIPNYITASGVRTPVPNNNFFVYYCYSFQDPRVGQPLKIVSAVTTFATIDEARAHTWETIKVSYTTLGDNEIKPLYKWIFERKLTFADGCKQSAFREFLDLRRAPTRTTSNLGGTIPASNVTVIPTGNISSTDAQSAIAELDAEKMTAVQVLPISVNAYVGIMVDVVCGETISEGDLCSPSTNGRAYKSNSAGVNIPSIYIATEGGSANETKRFLKQGLVRNSTLTLSIGGTVYVGADSKPTTTKPNNGSTIQVIGRAKSATEFEFDPTLWTEDEKVVNLHETSEPASATGYVKVFNAIGSVLKSINPSGIKHWLNAVLEHTPTRGDLLVYNGTTGYTSQPTEQDDTFVKASVMNISTDGLLTVMIPAGYEILSLYAEETNNTAAGNIALGSTALGTDVVASTAVGAMHDGKLTVAKPYFSKNNNTSLYISSSAWGLSSINLYFTFIKTR